MFHDQFFPHRNSAGNLLKITISGQAPCSYQALVWEEFFATRGRGISLPAHFPWLVTPVKHVHYVLAWIGDLLVGGLAVRADRFEPELIGSIGLVCVHPEHRGEGIGTRLLEIAIEVGRSQGFGAMRLWTQKQSVYTRHGFIEADTAVFGTVERPLTAQEDRASTLATGAMMRFDISAQCGVPAFALRVEALERDGAKLTLIEDRQGSIVSSWTGDDLIVADLMEQALPRTVRMNAFVNQALLPILVARQWSLNLTQCHLQMILPLGERSASAWEDRLRTPVTARI